MSVQKRNFMTKERNPFIIPDKDDTPTGNVCPFCKVANYEARTANGVILFTCKEELCRNQWQRGLPRVPEDPRVPKPSTNPKDRPSVEFNPVYHRTETGAVEIIDWREEDRRVDLTQEFRKGALIPDGEDDEFGY
jgi:hypothetical protein